MDFVQQVLYYPHYQPKLPWLMSMLLLTDRVLRIVPHDADPEDSDSIKRLIQEIPGSLVSRSPDFVDIDFDSLTLERLRIAFRHIRTSGHSHDKIKLQLGNGAMSIEGHIFLHNEKVAPRLREILLEEGLLVPKLEEFASAMANESVHPVPEQASKLILSCIADRIARREGLDTATDESYDYTVTALNSQKVSLGSPQGAVEGALLSAIATLTIPANIQLIDMQTYRDLRESYSGLRRAFNEYVTQIISINRLGHIEDFKVLMERISTAAEQVRKETDQLMKVRPMNQFKKWAPFALSSMLAVAGSAVGSPEMGIPIAIGGIGVNLINRVFIEKDNEPIPSKACRLLADLRNDLQKAISIAELT